jgi:hypothetical protein
MREFIEGTEGLPVKKVEKIRPATLGVALVGWWLGPSNPGTQARSAMQCPDGLWLPTHPSVSDRRSDVHGNTKLSQLRTAGSLPVACRCCDFALAAHSMI